MLDFFRTETANETHDTMSAKRPWHLPWENNANLDAYNVNGHYTLLMNDLHRTARDLQDAYRNLENVVDPDLIDCYIYELNAVQMRYKFLLNSIKKVEDPYTKNPLEVSKS